MKKLFFIFATMLAANAMAGWVKPDAVVPTYHLTEEDPYYQADKSNIVTRSQLVPTIQTTRWENVNASGIDLSADPSAQLLLNSSFSVYSNSWLVTTGLWYCYASPYASPVVADCISWRINLYDHGFLQYTNPLPITIGNTYKIVMVAGWDALGDVLTLVTSFAGVTVTNTATPQLVTVTNTFVATTNLPLTITFHRDPIWDDQAHIYSVALYCTGGGALTAQGPIKSLESAEAPAFLDGTNILDISTGEWNGRGITEDTLPGQVSIYGLLLTNQNQQLAVISTNFTQDCTNGTFDTGIEGWTPTVASWDSDRQAAQIGPKTNPMSPQIAWAKSSIPFSNQVVTLSWTAFATNTQPYVVGFYPKPGSPSTYIYTQSVDVVTTNSRVLTNQAGYATPFFFGLGSSSNALWLDDVTFTFESLGTKTLIGTSDIPAHISSMQFGPYTFGGPTLVVTNDGIITLTTNAAGELVIGATGAGGGGGDVYVASNNTYAAETTQTLRHALSEDLIIESSGTNRLTISNPTDAANVEVLRFMHDGIKRFDITDGGLNWNWRSGHSEIRQYTPNRYLKIRCYGSTGDNRIQISPINNITRSSSGIWSLLEVQGTILPTSGGAEERFVHINPTFNQQGSATGSLYGLYVNVVATSARGLWYPLYVNVGTSSFDVVRCRGNALFDAGITVDQGNEIRFRADYAVTNADVGLRVKVLGTTNELYAFDSSGNEQQLTAHKIIDGKRVRVLHERNLYTGEGTIINMDALAEAVQQLSGRTDIVTRYTFAPVRNWDAEQAALVEQSLFARAAWQKAIEDYPKLESAWQTEQVEKSKEHEDWQKLPEKDRGNTEEPDIPQPPPSPSKIPPVIYEPKPQPGWLSDSIKEKP